jgi:ABC-type antimicrobial peptide transport system permease subunit
MLSPRWRKVLSDLLGNKSRTALMILTISAGVFSVGFTTALGDIMISAMDADYAASNGHAAILSCTPFTFMLNPVGMLVWLLLVVSIAVIASAFPATNAMRLTIREVLTYE